MLVVDASVAVRAAGVERGFAPVERHAGGELGREVWRVAEELGWARTHDAEYVAPARLLDCPPVTFDARLRRGAARLVAGASPAEL